MMKANWSSGSRRFSVCSTAPMQGTAEVELEVAGGIPGQRAHAVALRDAQLFQRARHLARPIIDLAVGGAVGAVRREA